MKITKRQLRRIIKEEKERLMLEMNPDGTVSEDEEEMEEDLQKSAMMGLNELLDMVEAEAYKIGGTFRGPGVRSRMKKMLIDRINQMRG